MTKRNTTKPVRVVSPIMEEQETSASTLQEWLDKEETVSDLLFSKEKKKESTSPIKVSRTVLSKIRYSANANSIHPN